MSVTPPAERAGAPHPGPPGPVIVLSPPRSFSTVVSMMLGQHPQLFGLPETQLFVAETVKGWWDASATATFPMTHGLLRAIAELVFGGQTEENAVRAAGWLSRRWPMTTGLILESLADRVAPRRLVEKSPSTVFYVEWMQRANRMFPDANFIHLTRHPRGHAESVMKYIRASTSNGSIPGWLLELASDQSGLEMSALLDPQRSWLRLHNNIVLFLSDVPADRQRRIRGEDVVTAPGRLLGQIARWLGLRDDEAAVENMLHPERSPFSRFGPPGAVYGNDISFLQNPSLRREAGTPLSLDGPLPWREDGATFLPEVRELAGEFGYE